MLAALCDVFHPSLSPDGGDDPLLFSTKASDLGVPEAADASDRAVPQGERGELRRLLRLLDGPIGGLVIRKTLRGVASMSVEERERLLRALSVHRIAQFSPDSRRSSGCRASSITASSTSTARIGSGRRLATRHPAAGPAREQRFAS